MSDLVKYICIGVPLYLGVGAALLVILGANRDRHNDEIQGALDNAPNVADEDSTHAANIGIPVGSQCDGADTADIPVNILLSRFCRL